MKLDSKLPVRLLFYFGGQLLVAFGIAFAIKGNLGISPISSPSFAAYNVLLYHGINTISYGTCVTISYLVYMLVQFIILRKEYKIINLLQIVVSTVFGWFVDFAVAVVGPTFDMNYFFRLGFLALSILFIAVGISFYVGAKIMPMPGDGLSLVVSQKVIKRPFHQVKIIVDCILVATAILISLIGTGHVIGVREGTVLTALLAGRVIGLLKPLIDPILRRFIPSGSAQPT